jgi:ribosomal protein S21
LYIIVEPNKGSDYKMAKVVMNRFEAETLASGKNVESVDSMLSRFKKKVIEQGILEEVRRRQFFIKSNEKRREKSKRAKIASIKFNKNKY